MCTFMGDMKILTCNRSSLKNSGSNTFSITTTFPSHGEITLSLTFLKSREGFLKNCRMIKNKIPDEEVSEDFD